MRTYYKVQLFEGFKDCCIDALKTAALINGGEYPDFTMDTIKRMAEGNASIYPGLNENTTIEQIGDNLLHIDTLVNGEYKTVCIIEAIEVGELKTIEELKETE